MESTTWKPLANFQWKKNVSNWRAKISLVFGGKMRGLTSERKDETADEPEMYTVGAFYTHMQFRF